MTLNEEKRLAFLAAFDQGKVRVVFDMLHPGVEVPAKGLAQSTDGRHLALDYSKKFNMPGFKATPEYLQATLSFSNRAHQTRIPWEAVRTLIQEGVVLEQWAPQVDQEKPDPWMAAPAEG